MPLPSFKVIDTPSLNPSFAHIETVLFSITIGIAEALAIVCICWITEPFSCWF